MTGLLTPYYFSAQTGHFRSSLATKALDGAGRPLPWYTYPIVHFLQAKSFGERHVLEFGAGQSTQWWSERAERVLSFEGDPAWFDEVQRSIPGNVELHLAPVSLEGVDTVVGERRFDVIVVDGLDRRKAACTAEAWLRPGGALILDNSEGYWGKEGTYPIMDYFRARGYARVDFYGHAPGVVKPHCTSLFFKDTCFLLEGAENPVRR